MNRSILAKAAFVIIAFSFFMLFSGVCIGQSGSSGNIEDIQVPPDAPAEKVEEWQSRRNMVDKEYDVCLEHCASDRNCEDKCASAYKSRMTREFETVFNNP